jgi:glycosyltransferase involved in cell wall biosynthesis
MRILVVSDLPHFVTGGAEMQAARLVEAWLDTGHEVVCLGRRMGRGPVPIGRHLLAVKRIRTTSIMGRWGRAASYFVSLACLLLQHRRWADVIYTRFLGEAATTAALLKAMKLLSQPLVATPANTSGNGDTNLLRSLPHADRLVQLLDRQCDAINLIADDMVGELRAAGFSGGNFSRIPNGIPIGTPPLARDASTRKFLAVGRLSQQKGYDVLLRALGQVRGHLTPGQVAIAGDGPERVRLHALARQLDLCEHVLWLGELTQAQVVQRLEESDVFLLPSRYEGMSNAGLEAMERGLALIVTECGGLDRYVEPEMGWVVERENEPALSRALLAALEIDAEALAGMGHLARQHAMRMFDMDVVAQKYIRLFETFARPAPSPHA